ncbi:MAG TPA: winged helix-turn-helix domain-containing protein [Nitrososphaeraceae archaeon]|nr:winged helix-turn-helix domain-containing protein [Nitrososphaeraceae archaeon]
MKKQDAINIIRFILEVTIESNNAKSMMSMIMYKILLNHPGLKEFWTILSENNLLSYDVDTQTFKTTEKGLRFLKST